MKLRPSPSSLSMLVFKVKLCSSFTSPVALVHVLYYVIWCASLVCVTLDPGEAIAASHIARAQPLCCSSLKFPNYRYQRCNYVDYSSEHDNEFVFSIVMPLPL